MMNTAQRKTRRPKCRSKRKRKAQNKLCKHSSQEVEKRTTKITALPAKDRRKKMIKRNKKQEK